MTRSLRVLVLAMILGLIVAGCGRASSQEEPPVQPSHHGTPPSPAAADDPRAAALTLLIEEARPIAAATQLGEITQIVGTCDGGREVGVAVRAAGGEAAAIADLVAAYRTRWDEAGWDPRTDGDLLTATTPRHLRLRLSVAGEGATLVASLPCTPIADIAAPPPLATSLGHLEPQAITIIESMVGVEQWTSTSTDLPCGDDWTHTVLTLEGETADAVGALGALRASLTQQGLPHGDIAAQAVAIPQAELGVITVAVQDSRVTLRAQTPCRPVSSD